MGLQLLLAAQFQEEYGCITGIAPDGSYSNMDDRGPSYVVHKDIRRRRRVNNLLGVTSRNRKRKPARCTNSIEKGLYENGKAKNVKSTAKRIISRSKQQSQIKRQQQCKQDSQSESHLMSSEHSHFSSGTIKMERSDTMNAPENTLMPDSFPKLKLNRRIYNKQYPCTLCGKSFRSNVDLLRHGRTHSGERPFHCTECKKSFTLKHHLIGHQRTHTGEKPYLCTKCNMTFSLIGNLGKHQKAHSIACKATHHRKVSPFKRSSLVQKDQKLSRQKQFHCKECKKSFTHRQRLIGHQRTHTVENPYQRKYNKSYPCPKCGKFFRSSEDLLRHDRMHSIERPFHCTECKKSFTRKHNLILHQRTHTGEKPNRRKYLKQHPCRICGKFFSSNKDLLRHDRMHSGERPFHCTKCKKSFTRRDQLLLHQRKHKGEKTYQCTDCNKTFNLIENLEKHKKTHAVVYKTTDLGGVIPVGNSSHTQQDKKRSRERSFHCTVCKKIFTRWDHLARHQMIHTGEKPYWCADCNKAFNLEGSLERHKKTHTVMYRTTDLGEIIPVRNYSRAQEDRTRSRERSFHCTECKKSFTRWDHLARHQRIHTGDKAYQCTDCNKAFKFIESLKRHKKTHIIVYRTNNLGEVIPVRNSSGAQQDRTHSREKPFQCTECKKSFALKHHLQGHERTHTGEKPYQCTECNKRFSLISNLGKHKRTHIVAYRTTNMGEVIPVRKSSLKATSRP